MGLCGSSAVAVNPDAVDLTHFNVERVIGEGGFGKVKAVQRKTGDKGWYAMKILAKKVAVDSRTGVEQIFNERNMLSDMDCPWIVNSVHCFQDNTNCYIVMDICLGGDLRYRMNHTGPDKRLPESHARFYCTQICLALEYLHIDDGGEHPPIIHRDIKPENVVVEADGYVKLTDLGISAGLDDDGLCKHGSGTPGYMAPELYSKGRLHGRASDMFALGVTLFELVAGARPFDVTGFGKIAGGWAPDYAAVEGKDFPAADWRPLEKAGASPTCVAFLRQLLVMDPKERLGTVQAAKAHPWFADAATGAGPGYWDSIAKREAAAPFVPDVTRANCDTGVNDAMDMLMNEGSSSKSRRSLPANEEAKFRGYEYNVQVQQLGSPRSPL